MENATSNSSAGGFAFGQLTKGAAKSGGYALEQIETRRRVPVLDTEDGLGADANRYGQLLNAESASCAGLSDSVANIHDGNLPRPVFRDKSSKALVASPAQRQDLGIMTTFAERLMKIMEVTGLRKNQFAELVGVRDRQVTRWLDGAEPASRETLSKIAALSDCSLDWLIDGVGDSGLRKPEVAGSWPAMVRGYRRVSKLSKGMTESVYEELLRFPGEGKKSPLIADVHNKRQEIEERRQSRVLRDSVYPNLNAVLERVNPLPADRERVLAMASSRGDLSEAEWLRLLKMPKSQTPKIPRK